MRLLKCGPWVRRDVDDLLRFWQQVYKVPIGRSIDAMVDYIKKRDDFKIENKNWASNGYIKGWQITNKKNEITQKPMV